MRPPVVRGGQPDYPHRLHDSVFSLRLAAVYAHMSRWQHAGAGARPLNPPNTGGSPGAPQSAPRRMAGLGPAPPGLGAGGPFPRHQLGSIWRSTAVTTRGFAGAGRGARAYGPVSCGRAGTSDPDRSLVPGITYYTRGHTSPRTADASGVCPYRHEPRAVPDCGPDGFSAPRR